MHANKQEGEVKIECHCGELIQDVTNGHANKAHVIPDQEWDDIWDQEWDDIWDAIDAAIEKSGPSPKAKERACMELRTLLARLSRHAWQCGNCGRIYHEQFDRQLQEFRPGSEDVPKVLFRSRPST